MIQYGYWFSAMAESDVTKGQVVMLPSAIWEGGKVNDPTITGTGYVMAAAALLKRTPKPTDTDIDEAMTNICRCGTYQRVRTAVHMAANDTSRT